MKLMVEHNKVIFPGGALEAEYPVLEASYIGERVVVVYDYMVFPKADPARNLFAYSSEGILLWRAEDIGQGATDAYTNVLSEQPLRVGNFAGFSVQIEETTGRVISKIFTK